jgi:HEAT repeat protein
LIALQPVEHAKQIVELLSSRNSSTRCLSAYILGEMHATDAAPQIARGFTDDSPLVRVASVSTIGKLKQGHYAFDLVKLLSDSCPDVREAAAYALAALPSCEPECVGCLEDVLALESFPQVIKAVECAILRLRYEH